ncbi:MAG TPA: hypothetical protein VHS33_04490 [Sphingomicrobium sp.]|jgi:hypothetical protein|nr:hypothetical protein [Sphingomicrobium sp.]
MTNFVVGHESRVGKIGEERLAFPPNHIEADHHLAFYLGPLDQRFGDDAFYVHLTRDLEATAESWSKRFTISPLMPSYRRGIIGSEAVSRHDAALEMVQTTTANITHFLKDKSRVVRVRLEHAEEDFRFFWNRLGAEGSLDDGLAEWNARHNEGTWRPSRLMGLRYAARRAVRAAIPPH